MACSRLLLVSYYQYGLTIKLKPEMRGAYLRDLENSTNERALALVEIK